MANKTLQGEKMKFQVDKNAFKGPFRCHGTTILKDKEISVDGNTFSYKVWQCPKCKKEFLDTKQAKRMEMIWNIQKLLEDKAIALKRAINHDGKMYFLRFPKEITKTWKNPKEAEIKIIDEKRFIVEVE